MEGENVRAKCALDIDEITEDRQTRRREARSDFEDGFGDAHVEVALPCGDAKRQRTRDNRAEPSEHQQRRLFVTNKARLVFAMS